jgi:hypothetical protein
MTLLPWSVYTNHDLDELSLVCCYDPLGHIHLPLIIGDHWATTCNPELPSSSVQFIAQRHTGQTGLMYTKGGHFHGSPYDTISNPDRGGLPPE